ncbi:MAG: hypothetical protein M3O01_01560 [Pseudomonadota bacterium]|nr:hypothetical protein [Pseudomonadota bacterium]
MNSTNYRFFHRDHLLSCRPFQQDDGRWQARVAIAALGGGKTRAQRFLDLDAFDSHDDAVAFAKEAGVAWVDRTLARQSLSDSGASVSHSPNNGSRDGPGGR